MLSESFYQRVAFELKKQSGIICNGNKVLRDDINNFIDFYILDLKKYDKSLNDRLSGIGTFREYPLSNDNYSISLIFEGVKPLKICLKVVQFSCTSIDYSKFVFFSKPKSGWVYFVGSQYGVKIGKTRKLKSRLNKFDVKLPFDTKLEYAIESGNYDKIERDLHDLLAESRLNGEWFDLSESDWAKIHTYLHENGLIIRNSYYITEYLNNQK